MNKTAETVGAELWRHVNWNYPNYTIARELGVSPSAVCAWRRRLSAPHPDAPPTKQKPRRRSKHAAQVAKRVAEIDWTMMDWEWDDSTLAHDYGVPRYIVAQKRREFRGETK